MMFYHAYSPTATPATQLTTTGGETFLHYRYYEIDTTVSKKLRKDGRETWKDNRSAYKSKIKR